MRTDARTIAAAVFAVITLPAGVAIAGPDSETLTLDVAGHISPACSISLPPSYHVGELSAAGQAAIPFSLNCNQSLSYALRSEQGGLRHEDLDAYLVPYRARLELLDDAAAVGRDIESARIQGATEQARLGDAPPFDESGRLIIHWDNPNGLLVRGTYRDTLTITLVLDEP